MILLFFFLTFACFDRKTTAEKVVLIWFPIFKAIASKFYFVNNSTGESLCNHNLDKSVKIISDKLNTQSISLLNINAVFLRNTDVSKHLNEPNVRTNTLKVTHFVPARIAQGAPK